MTIEFPVTIKMRSAAATSQLASEIAPLLVSGDTLLLKGDIGAGKTHFARSLIQARLAAAGYFEDVPSPTYTLVQTYSDNLTEIWHADLYRLSDVSEVSELGLEDAISEAVCLIEWPERLGPLCPTNALHIDFEVGRETETRILTFSADDSRWSKIAAVV